MRIIGVVDLKAGQVVRGIAGRRDEYRPVTSTLADDATPQAVGKAFSGRLQLAEVYVADLDAIGGAEPDWDALRVLSRCGLKLWVDAGVSTVERARQLAEFEVDGQPLAGVIVGLETLVSLSELKPLVDVVGVERLVFSLDLKAGRPLSSTADVQRMKPVEIAAVAIDAGVRRIIVLDLAGVGTNDGVNTLELCRELRGREPTLEITSGGGVRHFDDLHELHLAGCDAALVASALHDGRVSMDDLKIVAQW